MKSFIEEKTNQKLKLDAIQVKNVCPGKWNVKSVRGLIAWISTILEVDLKSFEDLRTGAMYCQILHRIYPESIKLRKVRMYTMYEFEFEINLRLLANSFGKLQINHDVPMQQLIRGPGNYDFCNWLYHFYVANDTGRSYDAKEMRHNSPIGLNRNGFRFVINLKRSQSIFVVKEQKSTEILRRNGSVLHAAPKANCKMAHPEVYYCYESRYVPLPPDSEVDTESANSESREFDNEIIHEAKPGVIHMDSSSKNLVHEYANNKDKPETLQKDTSCENIVHETEKEECKRTAKIDPIPGRRDIFRKQEMEILNLRKQQRECAANLDSIKAVLLEDSYDSDRCLKNIRKIVFNNSESELYDNPE